jgi:hypothetical protein
MRFTACWASSACGMCTDRRKPPRQIILSRSSSRSYSRFTDSTVRSAPPAARREGPRRPRSRGLRTFENDLGTASFAEGTEIRRAADYPTRVRQTSRPKLHVHSCLHPSLLLNPQQTTARSAY